ncbi:Rrf2 family transcriptional regulator [Nitratidesulfovibrio sp. HK-II]|uniref:RrF2 family transcriptional regulator n=1 Tax=Nitratidesulfovibrio sp. HK-II TaxID=2009266 RepID=UPI000E2E7C7D|nr:Rrf2 family transcriptional regulator [Nitratidesulfovibrio sp. HK-II]GBO95668.1 Rrf2 family transcriptional regulator [Nitratidesulfovibrio sp. HK-II]
MKLAAKTRYAARILLALAMHGEDAPMTTTALSQHTGVTVQFIEQILKTLKRGGLTRSSRGASGGHMLARTPEDITLGEIVRLMEGGIQLTVCCSGDANACARRASCLTRSAWVRASQALERSLEETTLATLMEGEQPLSPHDEAVCRTADGDTAGARRSAARRPARATNPAELY